MKRKASSKTFVVHSITDEIVATFPKREDALAFASAENGKHGAALNIANKLWVREA